MAKVSCSVKFGPFKWIRAGYAETMDEQGVQSMLDQEADALGGEGYVVRPRKGRIATGRTIKGRAISTADKESYERELRDNRLLRKLSGF